MAVLDMFRRGWGWVWLLGAAELALVGSEALPLLQPAPPMQRLAPVVTKGDSPARVSLQPILDFQPFGAPDIPAPTAAAETPIAEAPPPSPVTEGYVLQGVLFREDGQKSSAILAWNGDLPSSYVAGDTLPSGATLAGVEANRVWLEKDGDREFLEFPVAGSALTDPNDSDPTVNDEPQDTATTDPAPDATAPPASPTMPQPDLRNLIPGLTATPPGNN